MPEAIETKSNLLSAEPFFTYVGGAWVAPRLEYTFDPTRFGKTRKYSRSTIRHHLLFWIFLAVMNLSYPTSCTPRCNASLIGTAISIPYPALIP